MDERRPPLCLVIASHAGYLSDESGMIDERRPPLCLVCGSAPVIGTMSMCPRCDRGYRHGVLPHHPWWERTPKDHPVHGFIVRVRYRMYK